MPKSKTDTYPLKTTIQCSDPGCEEQVGAKNDQFPLGITTVRCSQLHETHIWVGDEDKAS